MQSKFKSVLDDPRTKAVMLLAYDGFTHKTIARSTGLSLGQVGYRVQRLGVSTTTYRRGDSDKAQQDIQEILKECDLGLDHRQGLPGKRGVPADRSGLPGRYGTLFVPRRSSRRRK